MVTEEKRFVVETSNRCGRRRFRWSFDRLEDVEEFHISPSSEKRPGGYLIQKRVNYYGLSDGINRKLLSRIGKF